MLCLVSLSKTLYPLLSTGSIQEDRKSFQHDRKIIHWDVKYQRKETNKTAYALTRLSVCSVWSEDACFACALNRGYHSLFLLLSTRYNKTCLKRPLKKKTKIVFQERLSLNAGQKYCRMLQESILQYF